MAELFTFGVDAAGAPVLRTALLAGSGPDPAAERKKEQEKRQDLIRRRDAVVDAARTLPDLSPAGVEEHVRRRWRGTKVLEQSDIDAFAADASSQRLDDVADALDSRVRRGVFGRGAKHVRVDMPRGWIRSAIRSMTSDEVAALEQRLVARGWSAEQVAKSMRTYRRENRGRQTGG